MRASTENKRSHTGVMGSRGVMRRKRKATVQREESSKEHMQSASKRVPRHGRNASTSDSKHRDLDMIRGESHELNTTSSSPFFLEKNGVTVSANEPIHDAEEGVEQEVDMLPNHYNTKQDSFNKKASKKITDIDMVDEQELRRALAKLVPKHEKEQSALLETYKASYWKWHFQLRCGFGLLMYGFGSKRALLEDFASSTLVDAAAVAVNGYLPTINIKHVIYTIADALWKQHSTVEKGNENEPAPSQSLEELVSLITNYKEAHIVYVLVHNIDGPGLRDEETQHLLAKIAASKPVRFLASVDHVNAPLLWDKQMANICFNWWWHHTPTFAAYDIEGTFLPLLLASDGVTKGIRSAALVLQSLTPNAQSVFRTLASHQLTHSEDLGLTQHQLYSLCRERFLVSSELTLRAHLTEFKDHQLVCTRRGLDGQDCLYIPIQTEALSKLLEDLDS
ncbi:hypothetical protein O6H91_19G053100 [Diphasiastrum complanatum]|uniref:Uncharacterized protein n=2 Tax=Diphasiastrum complanatum TaxID=34168 RepID=A0ACC2AVI4_DIPCM|nr:hypothetical protein O6H91_19G053100 [Diphasiastrum complanatum]